MNFTFSIFYFRLQFTVCGSLCVSCCVNPDPGSPKVKDLLDPDHQGGRSGSGRPKKYGNKSFGYGSVIFLRFRILPSAVEGVGRIKINASQKLKLIILLFKTIIFNPRIPYTVV